MDAELLKWLADRTDGETLAVIAAALMGCGN